MSLFGERLSRQVGLDRDPDLHLPVANELTSESLDFRPKDAAKLPPMILMSGMKDTIVPW
jgi:hypothetical protein